MANDNVIEVYNTKSVDLDQLLAELGGGIRLVVNRQEPLWCDGYLGTLEVDHDDVVSMENLRELFGGRKLKIKVLNGDGQIVAVRTVKFPDDPKKDGVVLKNPAENGSGGNSSTDLLNLFMRSQEALIAAQADNQRAMMEMQEKQNATIQGLLMDRITDQQRTPQFSPTQQSFKETIEMVEFLEQLQNRLGNKAQEEEINPIHKEIIDMGKTFFGFKLEQEKMKFQHQMDQMRANTVPALPERQQEPDDDDQEEISDSELMEMAAERFSSLPLTEQRRVASMFFNNLQSEQKSSSEKQKHPVKSDQSVENKNETVSGPGLDLDMDPDDRDELARVDTGSTGKVSEQV